MHRYQAGTSLPQVQGIVKLSRVGTYSTRNNPAPGVTKEVVPPLQNAMASQENFATLPRYSTQNAFSEQVILHVPSSPHFINISRSKLSIPVLCLSLESKQSSLLICSSPSRIRPTAITANRKSISPTYFYPTRSRQRSSKPNGSPCPLPRYDEPASEP